MSYQDRVIRDNPVGYWILDSSPSMGTDYSAGYFSNDDVLSLTPNSAGDVWTNSTGNNDSVTVGQSYTATSYARTSVGNRNSYIRIDWYNSSNVLISTSPGSTISINNSSWTQISVTATAPANATYAITTITIQSTTGTSDLQYVKNIIFNNSYLLLSRFVAGTNTTLSVSKYFSRNNNTATIGAGVVSTDVLPLCTGGTNSARISSGATSKITIANNYEIAYKYNEGKDFSLEFWLSFDSIPTSSTVLTIGPNLTLSFADNLATLKLIDSSSNTYYSYLKIDDYDSQFHIVLVYSNRSMYFYVNGLASNTVSIPERLYFGSTTAQSIVFGPSTGSDYFIIDCISLYQYHLDYQKIASHIGWAVNNNNPQTYTIANSGGVYDAYEEDGQINEKFVYNSDISWSSGTMNNCIVDRGELTVKEIAPLEPYNPVTTAAIGYTTYLTRTGLTTTGHNSARTNMFEKNYDPQSQTIQCQVYVQTTANREVYFSITGFTFGTLVLSKPGASTTLRLFSDNDTSVDIASTTLTEGSWNNVRITFSGNTVTLTVNGTVSGTDVISTGDVSLSNSTLFMGNYYNYSYNNTNIPTAYPTTSPIQNFSVHDNSSSRITSYANVGNFTAVLNNTLNISQYAEWKILLPLDQTTSINGSKLYYVKSSNNINIYASSDNTTWVQQVTSGEQIPGLQLNTTAVPTYIKITMQTSDSLNARTSIRYMEILTYQTMFSYSNGYNFNIKEYVGSNQYHTYNLKDRQFNLLARANNFGVHFEPENGVQVPGMAVINVPSGNTYRTIEFWFRVDTNAGAANNYLLDVDNPTAASLSHNASLVLNYAGADWSAVYINGQSYTNNSKTLVLGEIYHFMGVLNADKSNEIGINAKHNYTFHAHATYGEICLYSDVKTQPFAQSKYNIQLGINKQTVTDTAYATNLDSVSVLAAKWNVVQAAIM